MIQKLEPRVIGTDYGCSGASFSEVIDKVNEVIDYINSRPEEIPPCQTGFKGHSDPVGRRGRQGMVPRWISEKAEEYQRQMEPPYDSDDIISAYESGAMWNDKRFVYGPKGDPDPAGTSDLEEAAKEYASKTLCDPDDGPSTGLAKESFIAGANYQHCKEAKGYPDPAGVKKDPSIDAGIDLYFYGKYFRYDRKPDAVYIYPNPETSYPGIPVEDWMEGHTVMNPSKLRAFAKYFYDRGRESYRVTIKGEDLIDHFKGNSNEIQTL